MKILAYLPLYPPHSLVGAWITTHEYLAELTRHGHEVDVVTFLAERPTYDLDGVTVHGRRHRPTTHHELVVGHAGDRGHAERIAAGRPLVTMVHGGNIAGAAALRSSALLVFNSEHLAGSTPHTAPSIVARPPVRADRYAVTPGDQVTLASFTTEKGGRLLVELARRMPDVQFLAVRGGYGQHVRDPRLPNLEVVDATPDARDIYRRTRLLLTPSIRESWGRVGIEAAVSGIPTIAHPTPGARESLGDAATYVDRRDIAGWQRAIRSHLAPERWAAASSAAIRRAVAFDCRIDLDRFTTGVERLALVAA